jgi:outer membrane protein assembly factor BamD (BamD/ComL family)
MKMNKIAKVLGALLLTGIMSGSAFAAENSAGVAEHFDQLVKTAGLALDNANNGNKEAAITDIKQAKQHYKELTGDASGKDMQDAIKQLSAAQDALKAGDAEKGKEILAGAYAKIKDLRAKLK